ncbi:unnamed protein product [Orchesella dallaii]|uniref:Uncharacterized protein n=1 Tax=Orchesella dallaii TaxID=48710 RepID=A0ABP1QAZ9_9HEXA
MAVTNGETAVCKRSKRRSLPFTTTSPDEGNEIMNPKVLHKNLQIESTEPFPGFWSKIPDKATRSGEAHSSMLTEHARKTVENNEMQPKPKTSTPSLTAKRFSELLKENISPIMSQELKVKRTRTLKKLGYPLLSSTKLSRKLDNDRLINAVRLYKDRLGLHLGEDEYEEIQSQVLRMNAHLSSFTEFGKSSKNVAEQTLPTKVEIGD